MDFRQASESQVQDLKDRANHQPRKVKDYRTTAEMFTRALAPNEGSDIADPEFP